MQSIAPGMGVQQYDPGRTSSDRCRAGELAEIWATRIGRHRRTLQARRWNRLGRKPSILLAAGPQLNLPVLRRAESILGGCGVALRPAESILGGCAPPQPALLAPHGPRPLDGAFGLSGRCSRCRPARRSGRPAAFRPSGVSSTRSTSARLISIAPAPSSGSASPARPPSADRARRWSRCRGSAVRAISRSSSSCRRFSARSSCLRLLAGTPSAIASTIRRMRFSAVARSFFSCSVISPSARVTIVMPAKMAAKYGPLESRALAPSAASQAICAPATLPI